MSNDAWTSDWSEPFVTWAILPPSMIEHMRHSVEVSYYKYGTVLTKDVEVLKVNKRKALEKYKKDGDADRLCDAANYDMFCFLLTNDMDYVESAAKLGVMYDEEKYTSTSSSDSTHVTKKTVSDWLRDMITDGQ